MPRAASRREGAAVSAKPDGGNGHSRMEAGRPEAIPARADERAGGGPRRAGLSRVRRGAGGAPGPGGRAHRGIPGGRPRGRRAGALRAGLPGLAGSPGAPRLPPGASRPLGSARASPRLHPPGAPGAACRGGLRDGGARGSRRRAGPRPEAVPGGRDSASGGCARRPRRARGKRGSSPGALGGGVPAAAPARGPGGGRRRSPPRPRRRGAHRARSAARPARRVRRPPRADRRPRRPRRVRLALAAEPWRGDAAGRRALRRRCATAGTCSWSRAGRRPARSRSRATRFASGGAEPPTKRPPDGGHQGWREP